jgi:hypothetical protein
MGTYISCKSKDKNQIEKINELWNKENPGYEDLFHLMTQEDMYEWLKDIHTYPGLAHLRYIKTVEDLNETFPSWGLGTFQVKITLGDYLCSAMAQKYRDFFTKHENYFFENPLDDNDVREIIEEKIKEYKRAEECLVNCPFCKGPEKFRHIIKLIRKPDAETI